MVTYFVKRKENIKEVEISHKCVTLLYKHKNRIILQMINRKWVSQFVGFLANRKFSTKMIGQFIKKNNIDMHEYEKKVYKNFNDFFARKIKSGKRPFSKKATDLCAPADSKLLVYKISNNLQMNIKGKTYTLNELLNNDKLALKYMNGYCLVFRLSVDDYHRYSFIDSGRVIEKKQINGIFHTVGSIAFKNHKVFKENQREYSLLETKNFDKIIQMEVGALMTGKIKNYNINKFKRGLEKGYFLFGGSTVILIFKNIIKIDDDILNYSKLDIEVKVKLGETIGKRCKNVF
ncbi:MAG: phosphatidylserine decarboxylase [Bacilli bacterium]